MKLLLARVLVSNIMAEANHRCDAGSNTIRGSLTACESGMVMPEFCQKARSVMLWTTALLVLL